MEIITLGHYTQTEEGNDQTPIEWLVLAKDEKKALLISRFLLDVKPYHDKNSSITWENCTLRKWLNSSFLESAFTAEEQAAILTTEVDNGPLQGMEYGANGGNNTLCKIFLLSVAEVERYFKKEVDFQTNPTPYAIKHGADSDNENNLWWLRSPGENQDCATYASCVCLCYGDDCYVDSENMGVRPAFWVDLSSIVL